MHDVEKICEMQRKLCEYERFHGELFIMLVNRDIKRQFVAVDPDDVPYGKAILEQVKKLIEQCYSCEK